MPDLLITRALPNPIGKDRTPANQVTNDQLNSEWIEFRNETGGRLTIDGVRLNHTTFTDRCIPIQEALVTSFNGQMPAGSSIRVHTGSGTPWDDGDVRHLYAGLRNYVWNNRCGDTAVLRVADGGLIDRASYERNPPEGVVLERVPNTDRLAVFAYAGRR